MDEKHDMSGDGQNKRSPEEIRADIERTRAELSITVGELKERVSPEHMKREILDKLKSVTSDTVSRVKSRVEEGVRKITTSASGVLGNNGRAGAIASAAVPVVLLGLSAGVGLLIWKKWIRPNGRKKVPDIKP